MKKRRSAPTTGSTTLTPLPAMPPSEEQPCTIQFGHNVEARLVCLLLTMPATQLIFTPEQAEDVARNLRVYARMARGEFVTAKERPH